MGAVDESLGQIEFSSVAKICCEVSQHPHEHTVLHPRLKSSVTRCWWWIPSRKVRPWCARSQDPQHTVDHVPRISPRAPALLTRALLFPLREGLLDRYPLLIGEVHPHLCQKTDPPSIPSGGSIGRVAVAVAVAVNVKVNASRRLWDAF